MRNESHLWYQKDIQLSTFSILFFGTPHQGSDVATWGKIVLSIAGIYSHTDDRLVQHLRSNSESIESGLGEFASIANSILIKYFFETLPTPVIAGRFMMVSRNNLECSTADHGIQIVEKPSAVPPSTNIEAISMQRHHLNMVKFSSSDDPLYMKVVQHLLLMLQDAPATIKDRSENWQRWQNKILPSGAGTECLIPAKMLTLSKVDLPNASDCPKPIRKLPSPTLTDQLAIPVVSHVYK